MFILMLCVVIQENEIEASDLDSSNEEEEEEWKSDSSRYEPCNNKLQKSLTCMCLVYFPHMLMWLDS